MSLKLESQEQDREKMGMICSLSRGYDKNGQIPKGGSLFNAKEKIKSFFHLCGVKKAIFLSVGDNDDEFTLIKTFKIR